MDYHIGIEMHKL